MSGKPELRVAETWDKCIENTILKFGYGALAGGFIALVLFRTPTARTAIAGFGAGVGIGMGYTDTKYEFDHMDADMSAKPSSKQAA